MEYEPCLQNGNKPSLKKLSGPDGLEAWCIAIAACFINFVMAGLGRMSGILYVEFINIFLIDRREAALPFSIRSSMRNLLGPVVGILGQKYGVRRITFLGGIIGAISAAACLYINDILWITIVWGGINGIGSALTTTLPQVTIGQHFDKYRSTASGMAFSGGCVGSFIFPTLMTYLLDTYAMGGTFLIISGIIMNTLPASMLLREPSWLKKRRKSIQIVTISSDSRFDTKGEEQQGDGNILSQEPSKSKVESDKIVEILNCELCSSATRFGSKTNKNVTIDVDFLQENKEIVIKALMKGFTIEGNSQEMNVDEMCDLLQKDIEKLFSDIGRCQCNENGFILRSDHIKSDVENESLQPNGTPKPSENESSVVNISNPNYILYTSTYSLVWQTLEKFARSDLNDVLLSFPDENPKDISKVIDELRKLYLFLEHSINNSKTLYFPAAPTEIVSTREMNSEEYKQSNTFMVHIRTALRLHTRPLFVLISMCRSIHFMTFMPVVTTIVDFVKDKGLLEKDGIFAIAVLSLGDLVGRLCFGWITDRGFIRIERYMLLIMLAQGAATISVPFMKSREAIMIGVAIFGLLQGSGFVRHPVLVRKYFGSDEQSIAMGSINFLSGLIGLALPSYIGYFRDTIGSYDGIFFINGGITAFIGLLWIFESFFFKCSVVEENKEEPSAV